jgi:hypothetical protein
MVKGRFVDLQGAPAWAVTAAAASACIAFLALIALFVMIVLWWRGRSAQRRALDPEPVSSYPAPDAAPVGPSAQRPDDGPDPARSPAALASVIRSVILEAVVESSAAGDRALILSPPSHPRQMTWHLHLGPRVSLDLADGRTVTTRPPSDGHDWALPSGSRAGIAIGDPTPAPGKETRAVRVEGGYLSLRYLAGPPAAFELIVSGDDAHHRRTAEAGDLGRLSTMVREALRSAASGIGGSQQAMGYSPESWHAHERLWIESSS